MLTSRRSLLAGVGGVSLGAAVNAVRPSQASAGEAALPVASEGGEELVAVAVNDALEGAYGRHEGKRRNHTKGLGAVGYFVGTKEAAELSRSGLFAGDRIEVIGRFSTAGRGPRASQSGRSLAANDDDSHPDVLRKDAVHLSRQVPGARQGRTHRQSRSQQARCLHETASRPSR